MDNDRDIKFDISDRSPLEEQVCIFKIFKISTISKWPPKHGKKR